MRTSREAGQAAPLYVLMVASLLFLALVFFAVGQAGATRNGAQSAADAAALAAARESRDRLGDGLLANLLKPGYLEDVFNDNLVGPPVGCDAAGSYAGMNGANVTSCDFATRYTWGVSVSVVTRKPMGNSILPGTESKFGHADATAIVEPRCTFEPAQDQEPPGGGATPGGQETPGDDATPDDGATPADGGNPDDAKGVSPGEFVCDDGNWKIDPEQPKLFPDMADLFTVRLAQD
ncbi:pilus assembly protein TadG-related protein [Streptomyces sp. 150FB]|uniref:pilus assembly protein TadG-related protein n=1 Tax=Streptomyces sp. 150FB TaxID=1576605 RepID=UPI000ADB487A|nr:pilus assembly protein TadG-related protein [Streptomyces sp. 150FB]